MLVGPSEGCLGKFKRSPEGKLDEKRGFDDQLSYLELKCGGRKSSSQCLVKSDGPKTCSDGFVRSLACP